MRSVYDRLALVAFDLMAAGKGYRFRKVSHPDAIKHADALYGEDAFSFPATFEDQIKRYKEGAITFVAYYGEEPVGLARLGNPEIANRPYEVFGMDAAGDHFEIQNLVVKKNHRDGGQFVMLGLFKAMYVFSLKNGICSWNSLSSMNVYLTIRRFCKKINQEPIDCHSLSHPIARYLFANQIVQTYYTMNVAAFEPWQILKRIIKQATRKAEILPFTSFKRLVYAGADYWSK